MKKNNRYKKIYFWILEVILLIVFIFSAIKITTWFINNRENKEIMDEIVDDITINEEEYNVNFNDLKKKNNDTVAWIKVNGTNISYPVVKANDNDYYLNHNFNKKSNSGGWVFADYHNKFDGNDKNIIIYGHNMRDGSMFGTLRRILNKDWYSNKENLLIPVITESKTSMYQVFSIYNIVAEDYYIKTNFEADEYIEFLNTIKKRSIYNFDVDLSENDQILTLSTCSNNGVKRVVLHAKKIS